MNKQRLAHEFIDEIASKLERDYNTYHYSDSELIENIVYEIDSFLKSNRVDASPRAKGKLARVLFDDFKSNKQSSNEKSETNHAE